MKIVVVSYTYPSDPSWNNVFAHRADVHSCILNPHNGPGDNVDNNYVNLSAKLRSNGIKVLGYVHTSYGARNLELVKKDIWAWNTWYQADGIFFDETSSKAQDLPYYRRLKSIMGTSLMVTNHGVVPYQEYIDVADILCIAETNQGTYLGKSFPTWVNDYDPDRFLHIVFGVTDPVTVLERVQDNNAFYYYMTTAGGSDPQFGVEHTIWPAPLPIPDPGTITISLSGVTNDQLLEEVKRRLR